MPEIIFIDYKTLTEEELANIAMEDASDDEG